MFTSYLPILFHCNLVANKELTSEKMKPTFPTNGNVILRKQASDRYRDISFVKSDKKNKSLFYLKFGR